MFCWLPKKFFVNLILGATARVGFNCKLADVHNISVARNQYGREEGKNTILGLYVCQFCKMTFSKIVFETLILSNLCLKFVGCLV